MWEYLQSGQVLWEMVEITGIKYFWYNLCQKNRQHKLMRHLVVFWLFDNVDIFSEFVVRVVWNCRLHRLVSLFQKKKQKKFGGTPNNINSQSVSWTWQPIYTTYFWKNTYLVVFPSDWSENWLVFLDFHSFWIRIVIRL